MDAGVASRELDEVVSVGCELLLVLWATVASLWARSSWR